MKPGIVLIFASLALVSCGGSNENRAAGDPAGPPSGAETNVSTQNTPVASTEQPSGIRCDLTVPENHRDDGRVFTEARQRANAAGERARVARERGRLAQACAAANGVTGLATMNRVSPGPNVLLADGTRGRRDVEAWIGTGRRGGEQVRVVVTESGDLIFGPAG